MLARGDRAEASDHRGRVRVVIRALAPDELVWFLARALAFQGHADPMGFAQRLAPRLKEAKRDAQRSFVEQLDGAGPPRVGVHLRAPGPDDDDRTARLGPMWHDGDEHEARAFVARLLERTPHDAAIVPLTGVPDDARERLLRWLAPLGFELRDRIRMRFPLSEVPPLGRPLTLEAWTLASDAAFRALYRRAERTETGDARWSWLKRRGGRFRPDLWFVARPTPDQDPIGYAFCSGDDALDAHYRLEAVGVLPEHRTSTEMVRRLVLTTLLELASRSPFGSVDVDPDARDPKLIEILHLLGFEDRGHDPRLERLPV
jgi:hypothetical protein